MSRDGYLRHVLRDMGLSGKQARLLDFVIEESCVIHGGSDEFATILLKWKDVYVKRAWTRSRMRYQPDAELHNDEGQMTLEDILPPLDQRPQA